MDEATATQGQPAQPPASAASQEPTSQPRMYSEKEYSDAMARKGREHKVQVDSLQAQIADHQTRARTLQEQIDRMEDEGIKQPDAKELMALKRQLRQERAELLTEKANLAREREAMSTEKQELSQYKLMQKAGNIAKGYEGVDPQLLVDLTDGSEEKMEALAKTLGKPRFQETTAPKGGTIPISEAGAGGMSDEAFWTWAANNSGKPLSPADMKRLKAIRDRKMNGG